MVSRLYVHFSNRRHEACRAESCLSGSGMADPLEDVAELFYLRPLVPAFEFLHSVNILPNQA